jgi:crossover junction endodeoxyribonuclease RusA
MSPFIPDMMDEQPSGFVVVLAWPDKRLSPNARMHWRQKSEVVKRARWDAAYSVLEAAGGSLSAIRAALAGDDPVAVRVRFYPPDNRRRDDDNMVGAFKASRDGIADALDLNDRRFRPHYFFETPEKPGRVEVSIALPRLLTTVCSDAESIVTGLSPDQQEAA